MINLKLDYREVILAIIVLLISLLQVCDCDRSRYNAKYNKLVSTDLEKGVTDQLPKQSKFFDFYDYDCEYILWVLFGLILMGGVHKYLN
jgi:hypothetical protein